ncbi:hypothetical protein EDEG_01148 [Edhazardia aedis USNM 41457]|uniref:CCHC-type domain-containing protein n=1 Tax=Edhazardia aedis (strain USNM 41457) TaxID=1003232 RepID=J9DAX9_EDHAE|nr:hypothetical protein EDEG_01148 [Edhazardia aedis USNM 41457]|eukprot:EJW04649.1 hypothetical protein EDEG_01148 [Edhazardia aedis USNM 41457]
MVMDFCLGRDIAQIRKYREESWVDFLIRLRDFANYQKKSENVVFRYLREQRMPMDMKICVHALDGKLDELIERVKEINMSQGLNKTTWGSKNGFGDKYGERKNRNACYNCVEVGHYSRECPKQKIMMVDRPDSKLGGVDERIVTINENM